MPRYYVERIPDQQPVIIDSYNQDKIATCHKGGMVEYITEKLNDAEFEAAAQVFPPAPADAEAEPLADTYVALIPEPAGLSEIALGGDLATARRHAAQLLQGPPLLSSIDIFQNVGAGRRLVETQYNGPVL